MCCCLGDSVIQRETHIQRGGLRTDGPQQRPQRWAEPERKLRLPLCSRGPVSVAGTNGPSHHLSALGRQVATRVSAHIVGIVSWYTLYLDLQGVQELLGRPITKVQWNL